MLTFCLCDNNRTLEKEVDTCTCQLPESLSENERVFFPVEEDGSNVSTGQGIDPARGSSQEGAGVEDSGDQGASGDTQAVDTGHPPPGVGHLQGQANQQHQAWDERLGLGSGMS